MENQTNPGPVLISYLTNPHIGTGPMDRGISASCNCRAERVSGATCTLARSLVSGKGIWIKETIQRIVRNQRGYIPDIAF